MNIKELYNQELMNSSPNMENPNNKSVYSNHNNKEIKISSIDSNRTLKMNKEIEKLKSMKFNNPNKDSFNSYNQNYYNKRNKIMH